MGRADLLWTARGVAGGPLFCRVSLGRHPQPQDMDAEPRRPDAALYRRCPDPGDAPQTLGADGRAGGARSPHQHPPGRAGLSLCAAPARSSLPPLHPAPAPADRFGAARAHPQPLPALRSPPRLAQPARPDEPGGPGGDARPASSPYGRDDRRRRPLARPGRRAFLGFSRLHSQLALARPGGDGAPVGGPGLACLARGAGTTDQPGPPLARWRGAAGAPLLVRPACGAAATPRRAPASPRPQPALPGATPDRSPAPG